MARNFIASRMRAIPDAAEQQGRTPFDRNLLGAEVKCTVTVNAHRASAVADGHGVNRSGT